MTKQTDNNSSSFFSGFFIGAAVAGAGFYLTMTKSGRKMAREILRRAEEIGEEGQLLIEDIVDSPAAHQVRRQTGKKIDGIIDKLKSEVKAVKKG